MRSAVAERLAVGASGWEHTPRDAATATQPATRRLLRPIGSALGTFASPHPLWVTQKQLNADPMGRRNSTTQRRVTLQCVCTLKAETSVHTQISTQSFSSSKRICDLPVWISCLLSTVVDLHIQSDDDHDAGFVMRIAPPPVLLLPSHLTVFAVRM